MVQWGKDRKMASRRKAFQSRNACEFGTVKGEFIKMNKEGKVQDAPTWSPGGAALDCPVYARGGCPLGEDCYAKRSEIRFDDTYQYRNRQGLATPEEVALDIMKVQAKYPIKYVRFSESSDFRNQEDVEKLAKVAKAFPELTFYGYSRQQHEPWIDLSILPSNVIVNESGVNYKAIKEGETPPAGYKQCPCDYDENARCIGTCQECAKPDAKVWTTWRERGKTKGKREKLESRKRSPVRWNIFQVEYSNP